MTPNERQAIHDRLLSEGFVLILCPRCGGNGRRVSGVTEMSDCLCCEGRGSLWLKLPEKDT
jgi:hypothetical protein